MFYKGLVLVFLLMCGVSSSFAKDQKIKIDFENPDSVAEGFRLNLLQGRLATAKSLLTEEALLEIDNDALRALKSSFSMVSTPKAYKSIQKNTNSTYMRYDSATSDVETITDFEKYYVRDLRKTELDLVTRKMVTPPIDMIVVTIRCTTIATSTCDDTCISRSYKSCNVQNVTIE